MSFRPDQFKAELQRGGARPNLFEVELMLPMIVGDFGGDTGSDSKFTLTCKAASLPESTIGMIELPYFGRTVKFAGNRTYGEWTTTIFNDEDFQVHDAIRFWMQGINGPNSNERSVGSTREYQTDATVKQMGLNGDTLKQFKFVNIWPSTMGAIDLDWGTNDALEELTVTWQYDHWVALGFDEDLPLASKILAIGQ